MRINISWVRQLISMSPVEKCKTATGEMCASHAGYQGSTIDRNQSSQQSC